MGVEEYVERIFRSVEKELRDIAEGKLPVEEYVADVLGIRRTQTFIPSEGWVTDGYILTLTAGGPSTYLNTEEKQIEVYWTPRKWVQKITDQKALEGLEIIKEYLDEVFGGMSHD